MLVTSYLDHEDRQQTLQIDFAATQQRPSPADQANRFVQDAGKF